MKLSDYDPSNFYNNRGYKAITSNPNEVNTHPNLPYSLLQLQPLLE